MRVWGRVWFGIEDTGGFVITGPNGQPMLPAGLPPGTQFPKGAGKGYWVSVETSPTGDNSLVYLTNLCQALQLNLNESPIYSDVGLPFRDSILTGIAPDYNMALTQQRFAPYFASLVITRQANNDKGPQYLVNVITKAGVKLSATVPIPT